MTREAQSFFLFAGEDAVIPISVLNNAGTAVDLSGMSARFIAYYPISLVIVLDSAASPATADTDIPNPANGIVNVTLADTNTDALLGTFHFELKVTDAANNEVVSTYGYITFKRSRTAA